MSTGSRIAGVSSWKEEGNKIVFGKIEDSRSAQIVLDTDALSGDFESCPSVPLSMFKPADALSTHPVRWSLTGRDGSYEGHEKVRLPHRDMSIVGC
jgi:hypothetical protein